MTVATAKRMSLEAYLSYDDGSETRYELVDGVLVAMGNEAKINTKIAVFLILALGRMGLDAGRIGIKQKIQVDSEYVSARDPDLIVHSAASALAGGLIDPDDLRSVEDHRAIGKIGSLINGAYQFQDFTGNQSIVSPAFPSLKLTALKILTAGK